MGEAPQRGDLLRTSTHPDPVRVERCGDHRLLCPDVPPIPAPDIFPLISPYRARVFWAGPEPRSNPSCREALTARAMRDRVRIRYLESAFLQIVAVIEDRTADEKGALRIDHYAHIGGLDDDVAIRRPIDQ